MQLTEAQRADLYTGLADAIGPDLAELFMNMVPRFDLAEVATKADLAELRTELREGLGAVNARLDRLFLALITGLFVIVAAMIGMFAAVV